MIKVMNIKGFYKVTFFRFLVIIKVKITNFWQGVVGVEQNEVLGGLY